MLRKYLSRTRFRPQLTVIVGLAILLLALFSSLLNSAEASRRMRDYLVGQGLQITESLARQSALALLYQSADNAREEAAATLAFADVRHVTIADAAQRVLLAQDKPGTPMPEGRPSLSGGRPTQAALEWESATEWGFGAPVYAGLEAASPFELQERQPQLLGYVHVVVGKESMHRLVASLRLVNVAVTLSFAAILLGVLGYLVERLIRPLNSLSGLMRRAEAGESGLRAQSSGPRDITDMAVAFNKMMTVLEEREAELAHSRDRALHTAQMKTQFAATVSHEVRTPLNGVVGMLDLLREMRLGKPQRECVDVAWNSAQALMELINGILDFSKLEAGKLELEEIDFDLRELVEGVMELLARQAQQKGLELGYLLAADVPSRVRGDSLRVRQVLINLMSNAVKFTERGEVAVHISRCVRPGGVEGLRIEVVDTGIGMDPDNVQHVFESFAQADPSTTRKYGGTGLGLTICKYLVDLMGGEIGVNSQPERGSRFWFTVPCLPVAEPATPAMLPELEGRRALVLARAGIVRAFLEQTLAGFGLGSQMVANASEALQRLQQVPQLSYALLVIDTDAVGNKLESLLRSLQTGHAAATPILLLGRHGVPRGENAADSGRVAKPLRHGLLVDAIRQLLSAGTPPAATVPLAPAPGSVAPGDRKFRVLVVEDNRTNQMVAGAMLAKSGCDCEFAGNGKEALEAARDRHFDLILMDCNMPEMDGYEATTHLRAFERELQRHTPVIAMTANAQSGDEEACLAAGMDDYMAKPVTLLKLRQKLDIWLGPGKSPADHSEEPPQFRPVMDGQG
jgi:signal transduction histidine kinase/CheY-like chemotaxis protein